MVSWGRKKILHIYSDPLEDWLAAMPHISHTIYTGTLMKGGPAYMGKVLHWPLKAVNMTPLSCEEIETILRI